MYVLASAGDVLSGLIFGPYWIGVFAFGFYSWMKYTHKGMSDVERRVRAMGYGLGWPYFAFKLYADRQNAPAAQANVDDAKKRILDD